MPEQLLFNQIKQIRRSKADMTQQDLADAVGCTRQTIIALEQNKYNPSLVLALKLAETLEVSVETLFQLKDDNNNE
ncbi:MAG: helix-turn-helix transcriptional regulator [Clostridia bacterium]|nr:helix-turn-helix transcriptional regulator [Clostridia bacterium]